MRHKKLVFLIVVLVAAVSSVSVFFVVQGKDSSSDVKTASSSETVKSERIGMTVRKDLSLVQSTLKSKDEQKGKLWEFTQPASSSQQFVIDSNYEQGASLKKLSGYTKQSLRDSVMGNINLQLPKQYPNYKELTQRNLTVNGIEANETLFEYVNSGVRVKQRLLLLIKNSDTAVYIRAQARADEYDGINRQYFDPIFASAKFE
jgi:hypothetical protein